MYPLFFHFAAVNVTERNARTLFSWSSSFDSSILWFSWNTLCAHTIFRERSLSRLHSGEGSYYFLHHLVCSLCICHIESSEKENDCEKRKRRINTHIQQRCAMLGERCVLVISMPLHTYDNFLSHFLSQLKLSRLQSTSPRKIYCRSTLATTRWGALNSVVFSKDVHVNSNRMKGKKKKQKKKLVEHKTTVATKWLHGDTMKWQNNLRSHEVRSEFNNSFSFVALALVLFSLLLFSLLTFYQCYRFCDMPLFTVATDSCAYFFSLSHPPPPSSDRELWYVVVYFIYDACSRSLTDGDCKHKLWIFYEWKIKWCFFFVLPCTKGGLFSYSIWSFVLNAIFAYKMLHFSCLSVRVFDQSVGNVCVRFAQFLNQNIDR